MLDPTPREIVLAILSGIAEFERQRIRERLEEAWRGGDFQNVRQHNYNIKALSIVLKKTFRE